LPQSIVMAFFLMIAPQVRLSMAAAGVGLAIVDDLSARAHRPDGLVFKAIPRGPQYPVYTVVNANRPLSQLGRAFLTSVQSQLRSLQRTAVCAEPLE
jgi:DNA-binding transcriptional LysR family regulator